MKLSKWAKNEGVSYGTALRWFHSGNLPFPAKQLNSGTILIDVPSDNNPKISTILDECEKICRAKYEQDFESKMDIIKSILY